MPDNRMPDSEESHGFDDEFEPERVGGANPSFPENQPRRFRATVHGTIFERREQALQQVSAGDTLTLIPDPPVEEAPEVWVHISSGDPIGHLPREIGSWLAPWLLSGGRARARALRVSGPDTPSWRRLLLEVRCGPPQEP